MQIKIGNSQ